MNSAKLRKQFRSVYLDFFGRNNAILSMPFLIKWAGDISQKFNGVFIRQKIPLRMYIGASRNNKNRILFRTITHYDTYEDNFVKTELLEYVPHLHEAEKYMDEAFAPFIKQYGGFDLHFLSELPRGAGMGFEGILSLLTSTMLASLAGKLVPKDLEMLERPDLNSVIQDKNSPFDPIIVEAFHIEKKIRNGSSSYGAYFASFFPSYYPIVNFREDMWGSPKQLPEEYLTYTFRYNELFTGLSPLPHMPIDYGVMYSGKPAMLDQIEQGYANHLSWIPNAQKLCGDTFGKYIEAQPKNHWPRFYKDYVIHGEEEGLDGSYGRVMGAISIEIFNTLTRLYIGGYQETNTKNFLDAIDKIRYGDYIGKRSSQSLKSFIAELNRNFHSKEKPVGFIPNYTTIMGGSVTFMVPMEAYRKGILDALEATKKNHPDAKLLYCSWQDGSEYHGLQYEQAIEHGVYSEFVPQNTVTLKRSDGTFAFGYIDDLLETYKEDIVLDTINDRVYLYGERLTSKELHAQNSTVEILGILVQNKDREVSNKELPVSSYSINKNEMCSKIIIPLAKLMKSKTGKDLPILVTGSTTQFSMKYAPGRVGVSILQSL